jgi:hypothetical protein
MAVTRINVDYQLTLDLGPDCMVVLEGLCRLTQGSAGTGDRKRDLDPERQDVAPALALFGADIRSAEAFKSGELRIGFDNGLHLTCPPDPSFEAWQVVGENGFRLVSLPGGELAVWSGSPR